MERGDLVHADAEIEADDGRRNDPKSQQPLEHAGALAAVGGAQAFGQIQRHHHAHQSGVDALEQAPEHERPVAVRQRDQRDAGHKQQAAEGHEPLSAQPVGQQAGRTGC